MTYKLVRKKVTYAYVGTGGVFVLFVMKKKGESVTIARYKHSFIFVR